jgi:hypothetical protein
MSSHAKLGCRPKTKDPPLLHQTSAKTKNMSSSPEGEIYVNGLQFSFTACRILKGGFGLHGLAIVAATLFESVSSASKRVCLNMMQNPWSWIVFYGL